jgi:putative tryptophan/tyrosine transport system substrate-binding protein
LLRYSICLNAPFENCYLHSTAFYGEIDVRRRQFIALVGGAAASTVAVLAQQTEKIARIGWLTAQQAASLAPYVDAFRAGLSEVGLIEGRNLLIVFRYGNDAIDQVPRLAAELAQIPVDLIVAQGAAVPVISTLGLSIPVVYVFSGDPVSAGLATTLAEPKGNMTGLTFMAPDLNGKRLELLREIIPELRRVAVVANPEHPGEHLERSYSEKVGQRLGILVEYFPTRTQEELEGAFNSMAGNPPQAISLFADGFAIQNRQQIIDFGIAHRAPVISGWPVFARSGAICTYGPRLVASYKRLANYVDRVLKGAKPTELPIEQPTEFELVINVKTAKALGLTIPTTLLARADAVVE